MRNPKVTGKKDHPFTLTGDAHRPVTRRTRSCTRVISRANAKAVERLDDAHVRHDRPSRQERPARSRVRVGPVSRAQRRVAEPEHDRRLARRDDAGAAGPPRARAPPGVRPRQAGHDALQDRDARHDRLAARRHDHRALRHGRAPPSDTSKTPRIQQLVAPRPCELAVSLAPSDTASIAPAINYVTARDITIDFDNSNKVATVTTVDSVMRRLRRGEADTTTRRAGERRRRREAGTRKDAAQDAAEDASEAAAQTTRSSARPPANSRQP